jgi:hypothetical protein
VKKSGHYLSPEQAAAVYDRIGRWQDTQAFYERQAVAALIRARRSVATQFPRVPSLIPNSRATTATGLSVSRTIRTAPARNS